MQTLHDSYYQKKKQRVFVSFASFKICCEYTKHSIERVPIHIGISVQVFRL
jgi:hypothetical protein